MGAHLPPHGAPWVDSDERSKIYQRGWNDACNEQAKREAASRLRATEWQPIETAPKDGTVILRPHLVWGAMDVRYAVKPLPKTSLTDGTHWEWLNGDYTTAWPDAAFLPYWQPLPAPPLHVLRQEGE